MDSTNSANSRILWYCDQSRNEQRAVIMDKLDLQGTTIDLFHDVLNSSIDWVWRATPEGEFTYLSPSLKTMTGFEPEELLGLPFEEYAPLLFSEESIELIVESLRTRKEGGFGNDTRRFELVYKRKDGSEFVGEMCSGPLLNSSGERIGLQGTTRDMTAHRLLVDELRNSIELFSTFFHSNDNPCCMTDLQTGVVIYANSAWLDDFDCSLNEIVGCTLSNLGIFGKTSQDELAKIISGVEESKNPTTNKMHLFTKAGEEKPCSVTSFSVEISGVKRVFTSIIDESDDERVEAELQKVAQLESASTLVAGIAHDINNVLSGVVGNLGLARGAASQSASEEYLDKTEAAASWLRSLTEQLLSFSKSEESRVECTDMGELLRKSVPLSLYGSPVIFEIDVTPDLWQVNVVPVQISQVINNLIINARQAMPKGGNITVCAQNFHPGPDTKLALKSGRYIKVSIADQGAGISTEIEEEIFSAFITSKKDGSGLGLTSSRSIIEKHKGHIEVTHNSSLGAEISFYLPAGSEGVGLEVVPD